MYQLNICHLYPDLLNLYGDRGNIISLKKRCEWRDIEVTVTDLSLREPYEPEKYDIVFLGGGQDYEQEIIQNDIIKMKADSIKTAIKSNKVFICICGGYQLLGKYYRTWDGKEIELLGALDIWTIGGEKRMIGNLVYECDFLKSANFDGKIVGFENHSGRTYLGDRVSPLGKVIIGNGNNGEDEYEGARYKNVFCSYSHGSLLPKNPAFSDYIINIALKDKYPSFPGLLSIDDTIENLAHDTMIRKLCKK